MVVRLSVPATTIAYHVEYTQVALKDAEAMMPNLRTTATERFQRPQVAMIIHKPLKKKREKGIRKKKKLGALPAPFKLHQDTSRATLASNESPEQNL